MFAPTHTTPTSVTFILPPNPPLDASSSAFGPPLASSSGYRSTDIIPLGAAKTVLSAMTRRAVIFSPRNDTKYFHSDDSIVNSCQAVPPLSIRSYEDNDEPSPNDSPSLSRSCPRLLSDTPSLVRSILKQKHHEIRVAASVKEGTLGNKEAARLLVSGSRPKLLARDSFQLAMMRKAVGNGLNLRSESGEEKPLDDAPGSDDSVASDEAGDGGEEAEREQEGSSDDEAEPENDGALSTRSLIDIILDGAEDLLTLEEAYTTLTVRLRHLISVDSPDSDKKAVDSVASIRNATRPIRDEAPAMVRAMQRDLQRLLGRVPNSEVPTAEAESSPFRGLMPLQDSTPTGSRARLTPSPTPIPGPATKSPEKPRQGYSESEVRYRRESSGVGTATLRFLAFAFNTPHLFTCFSEADLQALLDHILVIPRTPKLPTPNPKRTYFASILLLAQIQIPERCVQPLKEKIARAVESAINDSLTTAAAGGGKDVASPIKKEGFHAVSNLLWTYPAVFLPFYSEWLPGCLRNMTASSWVIRNKASVAAAAYARAKTFLLRDFQSRTVAERDPASREAWVKVRTTSHKSEFYVVSQLKSVLKSPNKSSPVYGHDGEKKTEFSALESALKDAVGGVNTIAWACATWAVLVSLIGSAYSSSGLAAKFDHIMIRSMQPSTNTTRSLLACAAWQHAIHAYFTSGSAVSITDDHRVIQSFKLFAASVHEDATERLKTIQTPVDLALAIAKSSANYSKVIVIAESDGAERCTWQRVEKTKRQQCLVTTGLSAASVVYAYTGMALHHEDQPAKEMTLVSGLPSSDGPMSENEADITSLALLDKTWDKVVSPMLKSFFAICGVDRLKFHGWEILCAITSPSYKADWSLSRLLSKEFFVSDFAHFEKEHLPAFLDRVDQECVIPAEIPAWGSKWTAGRVESLLMIFQEALTGIHGLNELPTRDLTELENGIVFPKVLLDVWTNIMTALAASRVETSPKTFAARVRLVTRHLLQVFNRDPISHLAVCFVGRDNVSSIDVDAVRIEVFRALYVVAADTLGAECIGELRLVPDEVATDKDGAVVDGVIAKMAFGNDSNGYPTAAGCLLGQLLRTKTLSSHLTQPVRIALQEIVSRLLNEGCVPGVQGKLLGDITNSMPWIFEEQDDVQLDVWRLLANKWTEVIDLQPSDSSSTNHTGALLVSLLSCPFRGRQVSSVWHQHADMQDLTIWQSLLKATVLRFRAKRVGSNLGVLESLAGHLGDFLEGDKTSSSTITLACLTAATSSMTFVQPELHHLSHYSINENFVPVDFLSLVSKALMESYPQPVLDASQSQSISASVYELLGALKVVFESLPLEFVAPVLEPIHQAMSIWMADESRVVESRYERELDGLYVVLLGAISNSVEHGFIPASAETLDCMIDIYAPRLSRAESQAVPRAFQAFWRKSFHDVKDIHYSEEVGEFLRDVIAAVPGMIIVPGISVGSSMSEEESLARFPHALNLAQGMPMEEILPISASLTEVLAVDSRLTMEYDADVSQNIETQPADRKDAPVGASSGRAVEGANLSEKTVPLSSPNPSIAETDRSVPGDNEQDYSEPSDVFGPAAIAHPKKRGSRRRRPAGLANAQTSPDAKRRKVEVIPASRSMIEDAQLVPDSEDEGEDCIVVHQSPDGVRRVASLNSLKINIPTASASKPSLLTSATKWLSRVPSFGLFSPSASRPIPLPDVVADTPAAPTMSPASVVGPSSRSARKARRSQSKETIASASNQDSSSIPQSSRRRIPVVEVASTRVSRNSRSSKRRRSGSVKVESVEFELPGGDAEDEDEEDELLLSPESARRRRREEETAIAAAQVERAASLASTASAEGVTRAQNAVDPNTSSVSQPTPSKRSEQQSRVLAMLDEAARAKAVIDSLDFEGVVALLRNVEELRSAATASLEVWAGRGHKERKRRRE